MEAAVQGAIPSLRPRAVSPMTALPLPSSYPSKQNRNEKGGVLQRLDRVRLRIRQVDHVPCAKYLCSAVSLKLRCAFQALDRERSIHLVIGGRLARRQHQTKHLEVCCSYQSTRTGLAQIRPKWPHIHQFTRSRMANRHANAFLSRGMKNPWVSLINQLPHTRSKLLMWVYWVFNVRTRAPG